MHDVFEVRERDHKLKSQPLRTSDDKEDSSTCRSSGLKGDYVNLMPLRNESVIVAMFTH